MIETLLSWLGLGGSAVAVTMIMAALWVWRGAKIIRLIGALFSSALTIALSILILGAVSIWLGWIDISLGLIASDLWSAISWIVSLPFEIVSSAIGSS
jgi:hypothetical protein